MQVEHILPLKQDGSESMKREVDESFKGSRSWLAVTNDGWTIDRVRYRGLVRGHFLNRPSPLLTNHVSIV